MKNLHASPTLYVQELPPARATESRRVKVIGCPAGLRFVKDAMPSLVAGPFAADPRSLDAISATVSKTYGTTSAEWAVEDATVLLSRMLLAAIAR